MPYSEAKESDQQKVPITAYVDLRDLYNALASTEAISGEWIMGMSKSESLDTVCKAMAAIGYAQDLLDEDEMPQTTAEAAKRLEEDFGMEFNNSRQQRIIQETQEMSVDFGEGSLSATEKEEEEDLPSEEEAQKILRAARSITTDGENHLAGLINIAQANNFSDPEIAQDIEPLLEEGFNATEIRELHDRYTP